MRWHSILPLRFLSSFFLAYSKRSQIGCLPNFCISCGLIANLECKSEMCCMRLAENTGCKNSPSAHHRTTVSGYIFTKASTTRKKLFNSNICSTCPHNTMNFGSGTLTAESGWRVWGTPANFNGFRVLASLLHWCRSTEVNQTLHDVCQSLGLVHYIYIFEGSCTVTEFCQNSLCIKVLRSCILAALLHCTQAVGVSQTLWRGTRKGIA